LIFCTIRKSKQLSHRLCTIHLVQIPGHSAIYGNELADQKAKEEAKKIFEGKITASNLITANDARILASEIAKKSWQTKWNEEKTGRHTYEHIPVVGTKILWPKDRHTGISYCRILLNDTMLNKDSYRTGTCESPVCECGLEEETVIHLFLNCNKYSHIRSDLFNTVGDVCSKLKRNFTIGDKVQLLLAPSNEYNMKKTILN